MGGLRKKMPITFVTFLIGGLALAGFPFVTAGFWSKDEIFAEAFHFGFDKGHPLAVVVFVTLVLSALMTAFYTARQISMTFLGKPRTEAAAHASENTLSMTFPLMVLAVFAVVLGYINIPKDFFLGFGDIAKSLKVDYWLKNFISPMLVVKEEPPAFNIIPVAFSLTVALGGLFLGWLVYGRKPLLAGQTDPVEKLGGLFTFLHRRWLWDELYRAIFVKPLQLIADNYSRVIDKGVLDRMLETGYRVGGQIAEGFKIFDKVVVTGFSDTVGRFTNWLGRELRELQTGQVQSYLLSALIAAVVLLGFFMFFFAQ